MARIGIMVTFTIKPGGWEAFNAHIRKHAAATLDEEPGCQAFDVFQPLDAGGKPDHSRIMLCEIYTDMAAFEAHKANPRMPSVAAGSKDLISGRELTVCELE